jgi:hypothetical protein
MNKQEDHLFFQFWKLIIAGLSLGLFYGLIEGFYKLIQLLTGHNRPVNLEIIWAVAVVYGPLALFITVVLGLLIGFVYFLSKGKFIISYIPLLDLVVLSPRE